MELLAQNICAWYSDISILDYYKSKYKTFHSWKCDWRCCLRNGGHFVQGKMTLLWCHNGRDGVSNHQPRHCLLNILYKRRSNKTSKLRVTDLFAGNSPVTGEFPAQMASNAENVSIWWRQYVNAVWVSTLRNIFQWNFYRNSSISKSHLQRGSHFVHDSIHHYHLCWRYDNTRCMHACIIWNHPLTHWGRVTHICVSKLTIMGSDNGLSPGRRQAIIWTNAGILLIGPLGTNFSEILVGIQTFSFRKMHLKMSSAL